MRLLGFVLVVLSWLLLPLGGCSYLTPYKLDIQQGNVVKSEDLAKLQEGMSKDQVMRVLGTPLLNDIYHADRWDYVHFVKKRGKVRDQSKATLFFDKEERLARLTGENVPTLAPAAAKSDEPTAPPSEKLRSTESVPPTDTVPTGEQNPSMEPSPGQEKKR